MRWECPKCTRVAEIFFANLPTGYQGVGRYHPKVPEGKDWRFICKHCKMDKTGIFAFAESIIFILSNVLIALGIVLSVVSILSPIFCVAFALGTYFVYKLTYIFLKSKIKKRYRKKT